MAQAALNALGAGNEAADTLSRALGEFRSALQKDLAAKLERARWAKNLSNTIMSEFQSRTDATIASLVDDTRHGMFLGSRFQRDPILSVITSVSNSPGAIVQAGQGNIQQNVSTRAEEIRTGFRALASSAEVQALPGYQRQGLLDVADVIEAEIEKSSPDVGKLVRWGERLKEIAEQVGVGVVVKSILRMVFGT